MSAELHYESLDGIARRLKARELSAVEATRAMLDRIEQIDVRLRSYATVTPERALADASARDAESVAAALSEAGFTQVTVARANSLLLCTFGPSAFWSV